MVHPDYSGMFNQLDNACDWYWTNGVLSAATVPVAQLSGTLPVRNGGAAAGKFTQGSIVFAGASGVYTQNNGNFFWDNTNARLGIGLTNPGYKLDVAGGGINIGSTNTLTFGSATTN